MCGIVGLLVKTPALKERLGELMVPMLIGMTERATMLGGTLQAGPAPDRGWRVRAVLPRPRRAT